MSRSNRRPYTRTGKNEAQHGGRDEESETNIDLYDKEGRPIDLHRWAALLREETYRRVAENVVAEFWVSTVWLGLDHSIDGQRLIFETMVFTHGDGTIVFGPIRYATRGAAEEGHRFIVDQIRKRRELGKI